jgi:Secretion system C-terminal sorting domain
MKTALHLPSKTFNPTPSVSRPVVKGTFAILFFIACLLMANEALGQKTWDGGGDGVNWNSANNWNPNGVPTAGQTVTIGNGNAVTVNTAAVCSTLTLGGGNADVSVTINAGQSLAVTGAVTMNVGTGNGDDRTIAVGSGTFSCGSLTMDNPDDADDNILQLTISTGNATVNGNLSMTGSAALNENAVVFSGNGTLFIAGTGTMSGGSLTPSTGTVNYSGTNQAIGLYTYNNLTLSGTGNKTAGGALTMNGNLILGSGLTFTAGAFTHNIAGNWVNNGATFTNTGSTISLNGAAQSIGGSSATSFNNLTLAGTAASTKTFGLATTIASNLSITGVIANLGSLTHSAGTLTLGGTGMPSGTWGSTGSALPATYRNNTYFAAAGTGHVTVGTSSCADGLWLGATSVDWNTASNWCNSVVPTAATNVSITQLGTGLSQPVIGDVPANPGLCNDITLATGSSLAITGTNTLTVNGNWVNNGTFTANNSTVIFNEAGAQSIGGTSAPTFHHVSTTGTAVVTPAVAVTIGGDLTVGTGTTFSAAGFALTVTGATNVTGTFNTVTSATGTKTFNGLVTVNAGGTWNLSGQNPATSFGGGITMDGTTFNNGTGAAAFSATQSLSGANNMTFGGTVTPVATTTLTNSNSGTVTISSIVPTGNFTQGLNNPTLSLIAAAPFGAGAGVFDASTNTNTVNYSGAAQTVRPVTYRTLGLSGSGAKTVTGVTTILTDFNMSGSATATPVITTVGGNISITGTAVMTTGAANVVTGGLTVGTGATLTMGNFALSISGATSVTGTVNTATGNTGLRTFTGSVTINAGGAWTLTGQNPATSFGGGITNNSGNTFNNGTGAAAFSATQALAGTGAMTFGGSATPAATFTLTNNNANTVTINNIVLTGNFTQGAGSSLTLTNAAPFSGAGNFDASVNANLVTYTGAAAPIRVTTYHNLTITGVGSTIAAGATSVNGTMTVSNTTTNNGTLTVTTALSGTSALTNAATGTLNIGGTSGITTLTATAIGNTVNYTGTGQTIKATSYHHLTLSGTNTTTGAAAINVAGNWTNNSIGTFTSTGSTVNFNGAAQNIGGTVGTFNNVSLSGTNTKTFLLRTDMAGNLSVATGVVADLGTFSSPPHTANSLTLAGGQQNAGLWGSAASGAPNQSALFSGTGIVDVASRLPTTYYSFSTGNWNSNATWSTVSFISAVNTGTFPIAGDIVNIGNGTGPTRTVTVNVSSACASITFETDTDDNNTLTLNDGTATDITLTVSGAITIPRGANPDVNLLAVGDEILNAGSIAFTNGGGGQRHVLTISTGTVIVNGDITQAGSNGSATITFTDAGLMQIGGDFLLGTGTGTLNPGTGTVEYIGNDQVVGDFSYFNLVVIGTNIKNWNLGGGRTIGGDLTVSSTLTTTGNSTLGVTGTTTVTGTLNLGGNGTKTFTGDATVSGVWAESGTAAINFAGGLTNNATTFTANNAVHSFTGANETIGGTTPTSIANVTVTGTYTNLNTLTATTTLSGVGSLTNGVNAILNIGGGAAITTLVASAIPNTVNYTGTAQTVKSATYHNLTVVGSPTLGGDVTINNDVTASTGTLNVGTFNLTIEAVATITLGSTPGSANMIIASGGGQVRKVFAGAGSFVFPIGDNVGTAEYSPITVNATAGTFPGFVGASVSNTRHPSNNLISNYLNRYWTVFPSGITQADITATFISPTDIVGSALLVSEGHLDGIFNATTNPWDRYDVAGGGTLTFPAIALTSAQSSFFTGIENSPPTLATASVFSACDGTGAIINLTGLVAGSTSIVNYEINNVVQTPVSGVVADATGLASFSTTAITAANNGHIVEVTGITIMDSAPTQTVSEPTPPFPVATLPLVVNQPPNLSGLTAVAANACAGSGSIVTLGSSFLLTEAYTITYNVSGTNTVGTTTASMINFTAGVPGSGTFTTAVLANAGAANVVSVTSIQSNTTFCSTSTTTNTVAFTTNPVPTASNFVITSSPTTATGTGALVSISSSTLVTGTYQLTYSVTGVNTITNDVVNFSFTSGVISTFTTDPLAVAGANTITANLIEFVPVSGCAFSFAPTLPTTTTTTAVVANFQTFQDGPWTTGATWVGGVVPTVGSNVTINSTHDVTGAINAVSIRDLTVATGATIVATTGQTITGNFIVNGTYTAAADVTLSGVNTTIGGIGIVSLTGNNDDILITTGNKFIPSSATLEIILVPGGGGGTVNMGDQTVTNHGQATITANNITSPGGGIDGQWVNAPNSTLNLIAGVSNANVLIHASFVGNTVSYDGTNNLTIEIPATVNGFPTYYNLITAGAGTKTLPASATGIAVDGNLTNYSVLVATPTGGGTPRNLRLRGNWTNTGNFTTSGISTVTLDGTGDQSITRSLAGGETFSVLTMNKASGTVNLNDNVTSTTLNMTAGNINTGTNKITVGTSTAAVGTLNYTSGTIIGQYEKWIAVVGTYLFPVGTAANYRPANITISTLGTAGSLIGQFNTSAPGRNGFNLMDGAVTLYNPFPNGFWSLTTANSLASPLYNLQLDGNGFDASPGFTINNNTRIVTRPTATDPWVINGTHGTRTGNVITRTGMTTLSGQYCFGDDTNCTAPVTSPITGNSSVCAGAVEIYSVTNVPTHTYTWTPVGGVVALGQGTNQVTVTWGTGVLGSISVVQNDPACTSGTPVTLAVTVGTLPPTAIGGSLIVPQNPTNIVLLQRTYTTPIVTAGDTYNWTVSGGNIIPDANATDESITVQWLAPGTGQVCVSTNDAGVCSASSDFCISVEIYNYVYSIASGNWNTPATWNCACTPVVTDNVVILAGHTVTLNADYFAKSLTLVQGAVLNASGNAAQDLEVSGNVYIDGIINPNPTAPNGVLNIDLVGGVLPTIDGSGTIGNDGDLNIEVSATILPTASLVRVNGDIDLVLGTITVTNQGSVDLQGGAELISSATARWINSDGSTLRIENGPLMTTGILDAIAPGNTVIYARTGAHTIKTPSGTPPQYANLHFTGTGIATTAAPTLLISGNWVNSATGTATVGPFTYTGFNPTVGVAGTGAVTFNGTSTISGTSASSFNFLNIANGSSLTSSGGTINVGRDFTNAGTFNHGNGTVVFNNITGPFSQTITTNGSAFFNFTTNKAAGTTVTVLDDLTIDGALTLTSGNLIFSGFDLTLNGPFTTANVADQLLLASSASSLIIGGPAGPMGSLNFATGSSTLTNLTLDRVGGGSAILGTPITVSSAVNLTRGTVNNSSASLTVGSGSTFYRTGDGFVTAIPLGGPYSLSYGSNAPGNYSTEFELQGNLSPNIHNGVDGILTQTSALNLFGVLSFGPNSSYNAGTNLLTVRSVSDVSGGSIGQIQGGTFSGTITVERFMSAKGSINRYVSSPVTNATLGDLANTYALHRGVGQSYSEAVPGPFNLGYFNVGLGATLVSGKGYLVYPEASFANVAVTWDVNGPLTLNSNQKDVSLPVSFTASSAGVSQDGWSLVGNPYPSNVVWEAGPGWSMSSNIEPIISVPDLTKNAGVYPLYYYTSNLNDNSGDLQNDIIVTGQAFWVHANSNSPTPSLTIHEQAKNSSLSGLFHREASSPADQLIVSINNGKRQDRAFLIMNAKATEGYDHGLDGHKLKNDEMTVYFVNKDDLQLVMHAVSEIPEEKLIPLDIEVALAGEYQITFPNVDRFGQRNELYLIDRFEEVAVPVSSTEGYRFSLLKGLHQMRFYLSKSTTIPERKMEQWLRTYPNPVVDELIVNIPSSKVAQVTLMDTHGRVLLGTEIRGEGRIDFSGYSSGMYLLKVVHGNETLVRKILK